MGASVKMTQMLRNPWLNYVLIITPLENDVEDQQLAELCQPDRRRLWKSDAAAAAATREENGIPEEGGRSDATAKTGGCKVGLEETTWENSSTGNI